MDKTIYEKLYGKYDDKINVGNRISKILNFLSKFRFDRILDIGCGDGTLTVLLAKTVDAKDVYGVDISEIGLNEARKKGIRCFKVDTDIEELPFEEDSFDFVFCGEFIEHVINTDKLLKDIHKVLKPNGKLVITTPNIASWHSRVCLLLGYNPFKCSVSFEYPEAGKILHIKDSGQEHIRFFTLKSLIDLIKYHNFFIEKIFGFYEIPTNANLIVKKFVVFFDKLFSNIPSLATAIGVLCKK